MEGCCGAAQVLCTGFCRSPALPSALPSGFPASALFCCLFMDSKGTSAVTGPGLLAEGERSISCGVRAGGRLPLSVPGSSELHALGSPWQSVGAPGHYGPCLGWVRSRLPCPLPHPALNPSFLLLLPQNLLPEAPACYVGARLGGAGWAWGRARRPVLSAVLACSHLCLSGPAGEREKPWGQLQNKGQALKLAACQPPEGAALRAG